MAIQQSAGVTVGGGPGGYPEADHWIEIKVWTEISPECYLCEGGASLNDCEVNASQMAEALLLLPAELEVEA